MLNNKQKAVIHVARAKTGMSEDEYRALLSGFGVASSSDLDHKDFKLIMAHFEKLGFKSRFAEKPKPPESKKRMIAKIYAVRTALHLPESYVDAIAQRMFRVDSHRWLDTDRLHKLVAALTYHQRKKEG